MRKGYVYIFIGLLCRTSAESPVLTLVPIIPEFPDGPPTPALKPQSSAIDYMVCKPVHGVFGATTNGANDWSSAVLRGPEGRPGPVGRSGVRGSKGKVDYQEAEQIIEKSFGDIKDKIYSLELEVEKFPVACGSSPAPEQPTKSPDQIAKEKECKERFSSPIAIGKLCYNILGGEGWLWSYAVAQTQCEKLGGNVADLISQEMYNAVYHLADQRYDTDLRVWTGLRFEDKKLMKRDNDTEVLFAKWTSGYPRKSSQYSSYYDSFSKVYIYLDTSAHVRRLYNARPTYNNAYAICSYDIEKRNSTIATPTATTDGSTSSI